MDQKRRCRILWSRGSRGACRREVRARLRTSPENNGPRAGNSAATGDERGDEPKPPRQPRSPETSTTHDDTRTHRRTPHYVSRAHASMSQLYQNILSNFLSNFICCFSGRMAQTFLNFLKMLFSNFSGFFFSFSLTWDPMKAKPSKRYSSFKSLLDLFNLFLNFLLSGPHKSTVLQF